MPSLETPELLHVTHNDRTRLVTRAKQQIRRLEAEIHDCGDAEDAERLKMNRAFLEILLRIFKDQRMELAQRVLGLIFSQDFATKSVLAEGLATHILQRAAWISHPDRKGRFQEDVYAFYQDHRDEVLWRLKEREDEPLFAWVRNLLPGKMPPKHRLSGRFPELSEVLFRMMDRIRRDTIDSIRKLNTDLIALDLDTDGFWQRLLITPADFRRLREREKGGEGVQTVRDARGFETRVDLANWYQECPMSELGKDGNVLPILWFQYLVLSMDELREIHPIVTILFSASYQGNMADIEVFRILTEMAEKFVQNPERMKKEREQIRSGILRAYEGFRSQLVSLNVHPRIARHLT